MLASGRAMTINFNEPFIAGTEREYIERVFAKGGFGGNLEHSKKAQAWLASYTGAPHVLLTHSCTGALEVAALVLDLEPGDEVIVPSFTFVATASAFARVGAKVVFCEIDPATFNMDLDDVERRITPRTRAIVPVHYAGVGCDMQRLAGIAARTGATLVEDAAQGVGAWLGERHLGTIAPLGCWSFHETKNVHCGLGGAIAINDPALLQRAEIVWERGTNRQMMYRGLVDKYSWVGMGGSFYTSEILAAFLLAQLEALDDHLRDRMRLWNRYRERLEPIAASGRLQILQQSPQQRHNAHAVPIVLSSADESERVRLALKERDIQAVIHYVPLHSSPMGKSMGYRAEDLPVTEEYAGRLLRLPMHNNLSLDDVDTVVDALDAALR
jgi:dTDP-4-amino-4,6-dideoxygalactose transaminase